MRLDDDSFSFDLLKLPEDYFENSYEYFALLREYSPFHANSDGTIILSRYDDCVAVYRDPVVWSSDKRVAFGYKFGSSTPLYEHHTSSIVFIDPPSHTRVRKLFQAAFTRKALQAFKLRIAYLVDGYLDQLQDAGAMEIVEDLSFKLPIEVVCDLLGVPSQDRLLIREWAVAILTALEPRIDDVQLETGNQAVIDFKQYLRDLIRWRRAHPETVAATEILTILVDAEMDGQKLTESELLHQCIFMLNAGHETSTNMISHGIHEMLRHPTEIKRLNEEPSLIESMVEEVLRYHAPIQINNRLSTCDTKIGRTNIPAGMIVHLIVASANRDPKQFLNPSRFDISRRPNRHLSFGLGIHICAGNALARLEAEITFQKIFSRFPGLQLISPATIAPRVRFREVTELCVSLK
ncbi:MAG: cytochrome P450 [Aestuariivita sp.]|nr:cytochrome P450 [Aestuariivita sp.]